MAKIEPSLAITPVARLAFPVLDTPKAYIDPKTKKEKGDPKYGATFLIPQSENIDEIKAAMVKAAKAVNPDVPIGEWQIPLKKGEAVIAKGVKAGKSEEKMGMYKGMYVIKASSKFKPDVSKAVNGAAVEIPAEMAAKEVYAGCYVRAELNFVAYDLENRYVTAYVNFIVKVKDGERLAGKDRKEVFKGILGGSSDTDPTEGDDEIAF